MKANHRKLALLSLFAAVSVAIGMGISLKHVAKAQEELPVIIETKGSDRLPPVVDVAEKLNPTVVAITNTSFVKTRGRMEWSSPFDDNFFKWFFGPQSPGPLRPQELEQRVQAGGSGVIISPDGEILTNNHVIEGIQGGDPTLQVKTADQRTFKATVLGRDKELDIALIKIRANHLPFAKLGDSDAARVGEWVVAIGNPLGLEHTVTQGIISAKGRQIEGPGLASLLQTDAAINRGNSGGPLLNLRGEVIGINTAIRPDGQNIGFAVPVNMVKRVLEDLRAGKPASRGYLGVGTNSVDQEFEAALGIKAGAVVSKVDRGTPADKAGIQRLDVITGVNGQAVKGSDQLVAAIAGRRAGEKVTITVWREGRFKDIPVILGDRRELEPVREDEEKGGPIGPRKDSEDSGLLDLEKTYGFTAEDLSAANRHQYGIPRETTGVVVTHVSIRSAAMEKGLREGLIIAAVGTRDVENLRQFKEEVKKSGGRKPLLLLVRTPGGRDQVTIAVPPR